VREDAADQAVEIGGEMPVSGGPLAQKEFVLHGHSPFVDAVGMRLWGAAGQQKGCGEI
jgi:hypothetical protein